MAPGHPFTPPLLSNRAQSSKKAFVSARSALLVRTSGSGAMSSCTHVVVAGHTAIGEGTQVFPFAVLGHQPQDLKYKGEASRLEIGGTTSSVSTSP